MALPQGGMISQGSEQRELQEGIQAIVDEFKAYPKQYEQVYQIVKSKKAYEVDVIKSSLGQMQLKPETQPIAYDSYAEVGEYKYVPNVFALGVIVSMEAFRDNLYMDVGTKNAYNLTRSELVTRETLGAQLFDFGYGTTKFTAWDGLSLFNTAHLVGKGGTFSNQLSTPATLNQTAIESAIIGIANFVDTGGNRMMAKAKKLAIPVSQQFAAERILGSFLQSDNANNSINALQSLGVFTEGRVILNYLNNQTNWFITTDVMDGLKWIDRDEGEGQDNDFGTSDYRYKRWFRSANGCSDVRGVYGSGNAGS